MPSQLTVMDRPLVTGSGGKKVNNNQCSKSKTRSMIIGFYFVLHLPTFPTRSKMMLTVHCVREGRGRERGGGRQRGGERERGREREREGERERERGGGEREGEREEGREREGERERGGGGEREREGGREREKEKEGESERDIILSVSVTFINEIMRSLV